MTQAANSYMDDWRELRRAALILRDALHAAEMRGYKIPRKVDVAWELLSAAIEATTSADATTGLPKERNHG